MVAARAAEIDATAEYPQDMFELLKGLGLFALPFPAEYGGTGSTLSACVAVEEFGRVCYNTGYLLVVQWTPFGAILAGGTEAQKQRLLPGLASGELRGALSLTEPQSGSDVSGIKTTARRTADGYRSQRREDLVHQRRHRRTSSWSPRRRRTKPASRSASTCSSSIAARPG